MRISVELPDWCDERHIYILAGIELAAYKLYGEDIVHVKTGRCSQCGTCCSAPPKRFCFKLNRDGSCVYLHKSDDGKYTECKLGMARPTVCSVSQPRHDRIPQCTVEFR